ncbi:MAG: T9SS type A sorting domain-containing protein [Chitinophagaceae bacterium]
MKQFLPFLKSFVLACTIFVAFVSKTTAQSSEFVFLTNSLVPGTGSAGSVGSSYLFPSVTSTMDAIVTIKDRSSSQVTLTTIDITSTGFAKALQPQIKYGNGTVTGAQNWWMEFEVKFVVKGTNTTSFASELNITALDVDGNGDKLREWVAFYNPASSKIESNSQLSVSNFIPVGTLVAGKAFTGSSTSYEGIDTNATRVMATTHYVNVSTIKFRMGGVTTGNASNVDRQYSIWFKDFKYVAPSSLPVKLLSFTGNNSDNKVNLNWTVATNEDADYYEVEKSENGRDFTRAAMVFPTQKEGTEIYSYKETISGNQTIYRLKLIDKNGTITYSRILSFTSKTANQTTLKIFGNPSGNQVAFQYEATGKQVEVRIYDMNGRTVIQRSVATAKGNNTISVDASTASSSGIYILEVTDGQTRTTARFVK